TREERPAGLVEGLGESVVPGELRLVELDQARVGAEGEEQLGHRRRAEHDGHAGLTVHTDDRGLDLAPPSGWPPPSHRRHRPSPYRTRPLPASGTMLTCRDGPLPSGFLR